MAINREAISDRVMDGLSSPAGQFSPEGYIGYSPNLSADEYNPEKAKALMAEAGFKDGFKLTVHGPAGRYSNDTRILEAIAQMLSRVGIDTTVETMPASVFFKRSPEAAPTRRRNSPLRCQATRTVLENHPIHYVSSSTPSRRIVATDPATATATAMPRWTS